MTFNSYKEITDSAMSLDISNYFRHFLKMQRSLKFISIIDPILILSSAVFPSFKLLLGYHNLCDSIVILLSLTMRSLKQLPPCRKCWSCICSLFYLFYFSDITPSLLMSMNRRISEAGHLSFVQNPSRDNLPLCHKLSRNLLSLFFFFLYCLLWHPRAFTGIIW